MNGLPHRKLSLGIDPDFAQLQPVADQPVERVSFGAEKDGETFAAQVTFIARSRENIPTLNLLLAARAGDPQRMELWAIFSCPLRTKCKFGESESSVPAPRSPVV